MLSFDSDFDALRHKLLLEVKVMLDVDHGDSQRRQLANRMNEFISNTVSLESLRILDKLMLKQKTTYDLYLMEEAVKAVEDYHDGPIDSIITEAHIARVHDFNAALHLNGNPFGIDKSLVYYAYMDSMKYAAVNCEEAEFSYLINNLSLVGSTMVERSVRGPRRVVELLTVLKGSVSSLSRGTL